MGTGLIAAPPTSIRSAAARSWRPGAGRLWRQRGRASDRRDPSLGPQLPRLRFGLRIPVARIHGCLLLGWQTPSSVQAGPHACGSAGRSDAVTGGFGGHAGNVRGVGVAHAAAGNPARRSGPARSVPVAAHRTSLRGALIRQPGAGRPAVRSRHAVSEPHHPRHPTCPNPGWRALSDTYCRADRHSRAARCAAAICPALMRFSRVSRVLPEMASCASARLIHM